MDRRKRIIYESDEEEDEPRLNNEEEKKITVSSSTRKSENKSEREKGIVNSDEEWDSQECLEFMHGKCDDEIGATPIKIVNEQLGDDGVEYEIIFEERRGKGRVSTYHDWVREVDLTKRMLVLRKEYEQQGKGNKKSEDEAGGGDEDGNYSSDENDHPPPPPIGIIGSNERAPGAPRRSSRGSSSGTRRAVTRQKLNDLIELRNRSKSGLGVLQLSSEDEEESESESQNIRNGGTRTPESSSDEDDDELVIRGRHRLFPPSPPQKVKSKVSHTPRMFKRRRRVEEVQEEQEQEEEEDGDGGGRGADDDIENFIVNDDEGEEELYEEGVLEERRRKRARRKEKERAVVAAAAVAEEVRKVTHSRKRSHRRKVILDDDEEDEEEEEEEESEEEVMSKKRRSRDPPEEFEEEEEDESEEESEDDEETDFSLYRRLENLNDEIDESATIVFRQNMSVPEAMTLYIDMIVKLLSPNSSSASSSTPQFGTPQKHQSSFRHREDLKKISPEHKTAIRKIEGLICTSRESLLGSSAWKGEFYEQLKSRPFYTVIESHSGGSTMCEACSRVSGGAVYSVYLYGPTYDSSRVWDNLRWVEHLPECILPSQFIPSSPGISSSVARVSLRDRDDDKEETQGATAAAAVDSSYSSPGGAGAGKKKLWWKSNWPRELTRENETRWTVTNHCMRRTQLYHTLLHYKLRLILKVKSKLEKYSSAGAAAAAASVTDDTDFVSCETQRFQTLVTNAGQKYGGEEQSKFTLWSDEEDSSPQHERSSSKKTSSASPHRPPMVPSSSGGAGALKSPRRGNGASLDRWLVKKK